MRQFRAAPDDFDHPDHEMLVSLVDERIDEIDREWVLSHLEGCEICRQDVDDLAQVKAAIPSATAIAPRQPNHSRGWVKPVIAAGVAAAGIALAVWISGRRTLPEPIEPPTSTVAQATTSPAPATPAPQPSPTLPAAPPSVLTEDEQGRVSRALATGRMELPPNMAVLRGHEGTLLGSDSAPAFRPETPVASAVIETRPQFSWTPRDGATRYAVTVFDERFREVAKSGSLKTTTWKPGRDLPRGRVLQWQVSAIIGNETAIAPAPPQPEARFMVLESATVAMLAKERQRLATEPIALGLLLAKTGLFAEADAVIQSALKDDRFDRSQVRALLARLRAR